MGIAVTIKDFPSCDIYARVEKQSMMVRLTLAPWAYMCERCFAKYGTGLGTEKGQALVKVDESAEEEEEVDI